MWIIGIISQERYHKTNLYSASEIEGQKKAT